MVHQQLQWQQYIPRLNRKVVISLFLIVAFYYSIPWVDRLLFVWQYTTLGELIKLSHRVGCVIPKPSTMIKGKSKLRIGLVMIYARKEESIEDTWDENNMLPFLKNRQEYCNYHNYTMINAKDLVDPSRPVSWSKLIAMDKHFSSGKYDYLFYIDMDTVIMNFSIPLEYFIESDQHRHDIIITKDWNGINFGVWIAKRSAWTTWFLRTAWNQKQLLPPKSAEGISYPFAYEQRAVHYLLDTKYWRKFKLKRYPGNSTEIRSHFAIYPQCAFNSYTVHPFDLRESRQNAQYVKGDFLVHFAGKRGYKKLALMKYYLARVDKSRR